MMDIHVIIQGIGQVFYLGFGKIWSYMTFITEWLKMIFSNFKIPVAPNAIKMFSNNYVNMVVFILLGLYIIVMNIWAFSLYGKDKKHAKKKKQRISEKKLMTISVLGGAGGGWLGMVVYSHKTQNKKFSMTIPILCAVQLVLFSFVLGFLGFWVFF